MLLRLEGAGELIDQGIGHGHLLIVDELLILRQLEVGVGPELIGIVHRGHGDAAVVGPQAAQVLLLPQGYLRDSHALAALERAPQQKEGLLAHRLGLEDVASLEVHRVDAGEIHEPHYLNRVGRRNGQVLEVGLLHYDVLFLGVLVPADRLVQGDVDFVVGAVPLLADAIMAFAMQCDEGDVLALGGRVQLDRDHHHPEADGPLPDCPRRHLSPPHGPRAPVSRHVNPDPERSQLRSVILDE